MTPARPPGGEAVIAAIHARRSVSRVRPDPVPRDLVEELLAAAVRAPNHHLTGPWRFVVLAGDARRRIGEAHARALARAKPDLPVAALAKEAARLERAPVVIVCVVSSASDDPVERREDRDAVAAGVQNLLLAAGARGLGAMWRTGGMAGEDEVRDELGLGPRDAVVSFVYLGWPEETAAGPSARPGLQELVRWDGW